NKPRNPANFLATIDFPSPLKSILSFNKHSFTLLPPLPKYHRTLILLLGKLFRKIANIFPFAAGNSFPANFLAQVLFCSSATCFSSFLISPPAIIASIHAFAWRHLSCSTGCCHPSVSGTCVPPLSPAIFLGLSQSFRSSLDAQVEVPDQ